jgi:hypothetical protein
MIKQIMLRMFQNLRTSRGRGSSDSTRSAD